MRSVLLFLFLSIACLYGGAQTTPGALPQQWNRGLTRLNWAEVPYSLQVPGDTLYHGLDSARVVALVDSTLYGRVRLTGGRLRWMPIGRGITALVNPGGTSVRDTLYILDTSSAITQVLNQYFGDTIIQYLTNQYLDTVINYIVNNQYVLDTVIQNVVNNSYFQSTIVQDIIQQIYNSQVTIDTITNLVFNNSYFQDTAFYNSYFNQYLTTVVNNMIDSSVSILNPQPTHQQTLIAGSILTQDNDLQLGTTRYAWTYTTGVPVTVPPLTTKVGALIQPKSAWSTVAPTLGVKVLRDGIYFHNGSALGVYKQQAAAGYEVHLTVSNWPADGTHSFPTADELPDWMCTLDSVLTDIDTNHINVRWVSITNEPNNTGYWAGATQHLPDYMAQLSVSIPLAHAHGLLVTDGGGTSVDLKWVVWDWLRSQGRVADADSFRVHEFTLFQQSSMTGWASDPGHQDAIAFLQGMYRGIRDSLALDAVNFHWYIQDWQTGVYAPSLQWTVEALQALSGKAVLTNEIGQHNTLDSIPPQVLEALRNRVVQLIWFDGDGTQAVALHNTDNSLRPNGVQFARYLSPLSATGNMTASITAPFFALQGGDIHIDNKKQPFVQLLLLGPDGVVRYADTTGLFRGGSGGGGVAGVTSFNGRTGTVTLSNTDVLTALGYTPYNATNPAGYISANQAISFSATGDVSGSASGSTTLSPTLTLATVNASVGTFGSATEIPVITLDGKGRATSASTTSISGAFIQNQQSVKQTANSWYKKATLDSLHIGGTTTQSVPFQVDGTGWINAWQFATTGRLSYSGKQFIETNPVPGDSILKYNSHSFWKYLTWGNPGATNAITKFYGTLKFADVQSGIATDSLLVWRASDSTVRRIAAASLVAAETDPLSIHNLGAQVNGVGGIAIPAANTVAASLNKLRSDTAYINYLYATNEAITSNLTVGNSVTVTNNVSANTSLFAKVATVGGIFGIPAANGAMLDVRGYNFTGGNSNEIYAVTKSAAYIGNNGTSAADTRTVGVWGIGQTFDASGVGGILVGVRADADWHGGSISAVYAIEAKMGMGYSTPGAMGSGLHPATNVPTGSALKLYQPDYSGAFPVKLLDYSAIEIDALATTYMNTGVQPYAIRQRGTVGIVSLETATLITPNLPVYASNAAAITGGLAVGQWYRNGDALQIVH
jgi:hypothetical protein